MCKKASVFKCNDTALGGFCLALQAVCFVCSLLAGKQLYSTRNLQLLHGLLQHNKQSCLHCCQSADVDAG